MAWHRISMLPEGALTSRTWRARNDEGHEAILREVPDGTVPFTPPPAPGVVPLREVALVSGRRMTVWDVVVAESLQDVLERVTEQGRQVPLGLVARVAIDASHALATISPPRPHGGLGDGTLLLSPDGLVWVMDFGAPRPGRFTAAGAPSAANDVFAMGGIVHAALTGYGGTYASAVADNLHLPKPSQLHPECTPAIDEVLSRAIARASDKRQPDLDLFAEELAAAVGPLLFDAGKAAAFLRAHQPKPGPPVADLDPGVFIDDVPTGEHLGPGHDITAAGQPPQRIPMGTQPGAPPSDAFSAVSKVADSGPLPGIPQSTQPGVPGPALASAQPPTRPSRPSSQPQPLDAQPPTRPSRPSSVQAPPAEPTVRPSRPSQSPGPLPSSGPAPRASNPRASLGAPPRASAPKPAPIFEETQPRMNVPPARAPEPAPPPNPSAVSHAKLEWAETQTRVPTPPLGTPAVSSTFDDDDDEDLPTDFASKSDLMGLGDDEEVHEPTAVRPRPKLPDSTGSLPALDATASLAELPSVTDLKAAGSGRRKVIAILLIVIAGMFGLAVWKKQQDSRRIATVTPVEPLEDDAGESEALPPVDAGESPEDATDAAVDVDLDAGSVEEDEGDGGELDEDDGGAEELEAVTGSFDAGMKKKVVKKKPPKRRRRR